MLECANPFDGGSRVAATGVEAVRCAVESGIVEVEAFAARGERLRRIVEPVRLIGVGISRVGEPARRRREPSCRFAETDDLAGETVCVKAEAIGFACSRARAHERSRPA
jgi:hypothetical protein